MSSSRNISSSILRSVIFSRISSGSNQKSENETRYPDEERKDDGRKQEFPGDEKVQLDQRKEEFILNESSCSTLEAQRRLEKPDEARKEINDQCCALENEDNNETRSHGQSAMKNEHEKRVLHEIRQGQIGRLTELAEENNEKLMHNMKLREKLETLKARETVLHELKSNICHFIRKMIKDLRGGDPCQFIDVGDNLGELMKTLLADRKTFEAKLSSSKYVYEKLKESIADRNRQLQSLLVKNRVETDENDELLTKIKETDKQLCELLDETVELQAVQDKEKKEDEELKSKLKDLLAKCKEKEAQVNQLFKDIDALKKQKACLYYEKSLCEESMSPEAEIKRSPLKGLRRRLSGSCSND